MIARLATALLLAVASVVLLGAAPAHACRCSFGDVSRHAAAADAVFVGSFPKSDKAVEGRRITFLVAVRKVYRGEVSEEVFVRAPYASATCGLDGIPACKPVVWFARGSGSDFRSNLCSGTTALTPQLSADLERELGPPAASGDSGATDSGTGLDSTDGTGDHNEDTSGLFHGGLPWWAWSLAWLTLAAGVAGTLRRAFRTGGPAGP